VRAATDTFQDLPSNLITPPPPQRSRLLAVGGAVVATFYSQDHADVPLSRIAMPVRHAIVAIEDSRFYQHHGVDLHGIARAAIADLGTGQPAQGASTLTQQYVKNVLIETARTPGEQAAARADTLQRKPQEARYALALERKLSKDQILGRYLNIVYFGDGAYGIEAAARHYFSTSADRLTLAEAALLAGLVRDPSAYDPVTHPAAAFARRNIVLERMAQLGDISASAQHSSESKPLGLHQRPLPAEGCTASLTPFFCA
jgi:membrane peptidoglycan carboxypeptidase